MHGTAKSESNFCGRSKTCEDTPMLATARLFQKIGPNARKERRYEPRQLPEKKVSQVSCGGGST